MHKADQVVGVVIDPTYNITALEKGETSTTLVTINACGQTSPPMVIHKGGGQNRIHGAKHGTMIRAIKNGWANDSELFTEHGEGFIHFIHRDKLDDGIPHFLALDQHYPDLHNLISPTNEQI